MGDWKPRMTRAVRHLAEQIAGIRAGTVSPGFVESVRVEGVSLGRLAAVSPRSGRIVVTPFDSARTGAIVQALKAAQLGAYALDPRNVAVSVPPPSAEERTKLAKHVKSLGEAAKVAVRGARQDARKAITASGKGSIRVVQEATDAAVAEIERLVEAKVKEIG